MAQKMKEKIFNNLLIISTLLIGLLLSYTYIIGNFIQPQLWVVEKVYIWFSSSIDKLSSKKIELNQKYNIEWVLEVIQDNKKIFDGNLEINNAELFSKADWLDQRLSSESISFLINNNWKEEKIIIEDLDIVSQNQNLYIDSKNGLKQFWTFLWKYINIPFNKTIEKVSKINQKWSYAYINNSNVFSNYLPNLEKQGLINQLLTSILTSNPIEYFEKNNIWNLLKQNIYNDNWIDLIFIENKNKSERTKQYFLFNHNICKQIEPLITYLIKDIENIQKDECEYFIQDIIPFIDLISQVYKTWDIENGNYDFVISQWTNINIKFTYRNHILQDWNVFIQNPENTIKISFIWNKFGIIDSKITFNYNKEDKKIIWNLINGTWNIKIDINNPDYKINWDIIIKNYTLIDMDLKWDGIIEWRNMSLTALGDSQTLDLSYLEKNWEIIYKWLNIWYDQDNIKIDSITRDVNINLLYSVGKFIWWISEKSIEGDITKEMKYIYDNGSILAYYKTPDIEWNIEGDFISKNRFSFDVWIKTKQDDIDIFIEWKEKTKSEIEYFAEWRINKELLFTLESSQKTIDNISNITADINIPWENIDIDFWLKIEQSEGNLEYEIPEKIEELQIWLNEVIILPDFHQVKYLWPKTLFTAITAGSIGFTTSYWQWQSIERQKHNDNIITNIDKIISSIDSQLENINFDPKELINQRLEIDTSNKIRIWWEKIIIWNKYLIGTINFDILWLSDNFNNSDYKIALLLSWEKLQYQVLGLLEESWSQLKAIIQWNYISREFIRYDFDIIIPDWDIISEELTTLQIQVLWKHDLRVWDMTNLWRILDIADEILFIENDIHPDISKIYLLWNDSSTLFIENNKILENGQLINKK